jgi:BirA family biotin operon repressor/biotin-[acetyl-CoA-carboxylase] ligase
LVGVGVNLNQTEFPEEIADRAVSLAQVRGEALEPLAVAHSILQRLAGLPEPNEWSDLAPIWSIFDRTPGKRYRLPNDHEAIALAIGSEGQLICSVEGESQTVFAADAIFA